MLARFRFYVLFDHKKRLSNDLYSIVVALIYYVFRQLLSEVSERSAASESLVPLFLMMGATTLWYCVHPQFLSQPHQRFKTTLSEVRMPRFAFTASIGVFIFSAILPPKKAGGALIDRRIRDALKDGPPYKSLSKVIDVAITGGITASPKLLDIATTTVQKSMGNALSPESREAISITLARLEAYTTFVGASISVNVQSLRHLHLPTGKEYRITRDLSVPSAWVEGDGPGSKMLADFDRTKGAALYILNRQAGDAVFRDLTIEGKLVLNPVYRPDVVAIQHQGARAVLINVYVIGLSQDLGINAVWIQVHFERCSLRYTNGPIRLINCTFVGCDFDFSKASSRAQSVRMLLESSPGRPTTISTQN